LKRCDSAASGVAAGGRYARDGSPPAPHQRTCLRRGGSATSRPRTTIHDSPDRTPPPAFLARCASRAPSWTAGSV